MPYYFLVIAQVFTAQACRVRVITHISPQALKEAPPTPSLSSIGSFHTLRRSFPTRPQAEAWAAYLHSTHKKGPVRNPLIYSRFYTDNQPLLFDLELIPK
jgi:hypothetical protein